MKNREGKGGEKKKNNRKELKEEKRRGKEEKEWKSRKGKRNREKKGITLCKPTQLKIANKIVNMM